MKLKLISSFIAPLALIAFAGQAWAYVECEADSDCIEGFICEEVGASTCGAAPCREGDDCEEEPPCEPETFSFCVPGPCDSDDDCSAGLACLEVEFGGDCMSVAVPDCPPEEDCPEPEDFEVECEEPETATLCLPPYVAPCETDDECGDGFECVADEMCTCSGGSGLDEPPPDPEDPGDSGDPDPDDDGREWDGDEDCTCEPTDERYCSPREIECDGDGECPNGWTCEEIPSVYACYVDESGEEHCDEPPEDEGGLCMPPYFDEMGWGGYGEEAGGDADIDGDTLEHATGHDDARPTGRGANEIFEGGSNGCQATPGTAGTAAMFWMLPLLIGLALRRRK